ncbi:restriction endonuclease subunit S [Prevotella pallens]|uniref:Predicted nucleotidyltransferases n=1 Tax=Prevotella pallens TaxID=60133 RepID=A0A379EZB3_9BACT|nr:restriction endonuclease subunit S [Prevotella pallens]SUC11695.1 Predicted nucleotidyltransferases [Prevotella pallens]
MEEWKEYKLGEVINILDYKRIPLSSAERKTREGGFPYYGAQGIIDYIDDYIFDGTYLLIAEDGENLKSKKQDIAQLAHGKYWVNNHAHIVESNGICDIRYLCYILNNIDLSGYITGSAQPKLNQANLSAISIILPPLNLQEQIADFISMFDNKIELNQRINDNLEQQAQALFKSWFVDNPNSNWKKISLSEVASFVGGYSYTGKELTDFSNVAMATIKNFVRNGGFKAGGFKGINPSAKLKECHYANLFDILVAHTDLTQNADVIGNTELLLTCGKYNSIIFSMDLVKVLPKEIFPYRFLLATMLKNKMFKGHCLGYINGTTVLHLNKKALPEFEIRKPSDSEAKIMNEILAPYYKRMAKLLQETDKLISLRDTLLPKLMSGELKINDINN